MDGDRLRSKVHVHRSHIVNELEKKFKIQSVYEEIYANISPSSVCAVYVSIFTDRFYAFFTASGKGNSFPMCFLKTVT